MWLKQGGICNFSHCGCSAGNYAQKCEKLISFYRKEENENVFLSRFCFAEKYKDKGCVRALLQESCVSRSARALNVGRSPYLYIFRQNKNEREKTFSFSFFL